MTPLSPSPALVNISAEQLHPYWLFEYDMIVIVMIYFLLFFKLPTTDQDGTSSFIDKQTSRMIEFEVSTEASLSGGYNSKFRKKLSAILGFCQIII